MGLTAARGATRTWRLIVLCVPGSRDAAKRAERSLEQPFVSRRAGPITDALGFQISHRIDRRP
jgi:hypothetical protein